MRREYLPTEPALELGGNFGRPEDDPVRFVVLGDSTAAGVGAGNPESAYPTILARRLASRSRYVKLSVLGVSGARVQDVLDDQLPLAKEADADLIFIGIGANDALHVTALDSVRQDMISIIESLKRTDAAVVVAGAPDMRAAAFYEPLRSLAGWRGRQVARAIEEAARATGVQVVELAEETGGFFARDPAAHYSNDEFHPGPGGYRRWADAIYPKLVDALSDAQS